MTTDFQRGQHAGIQLHRQIDEMNELLAELGLAHGPCTCPDHGYVFALATALQAVLHTADNPDATAIDAANAALVGYETGRAISEAL
jgi:hypothetical protein